MADFGLSDAGFLAPRTADFLEMIRNDYESATNLSIDWERDTFLGQITAIMADRLGEIADAAQAVYDATDPSNATGAQLDNLAILVGVFRQLPTYSQAVATFTGLVGTIITAGRRVQGGTDPLTRWRLASDVTLSTLTLTTGNLSFTAGSATAFGRITRVSGSWIEDGVGVGTVLTVASSVSNNKAFTVEGLISDTVIEVRQGVVAEGAVAATATGAFGSGTLIAVESGALSAGQTTIDTIVTPVGGWHAVSNAAPATVGSALESDEELRGRRQTALAVSGAASIKAIRSNLLELSILTAATVVENDSNVTAVVGGKTLPPKSYAVVVWPNTLTTEQQELVAETIYNTGPAGIEIVGTDVTADVTGSDGYVKSVAFDFATTLAVNVVTTVALSTGYVLANVQTTVENLVVDYFANLTVGQAVRTLELSALIATVVGVVGASFTLNGSGVDIEPTISQIAELGTNTVTT